MDSEFFFLLKAYAQAYSRATDCMNAHFESESDVNKKLWEDAATEAIEREKSLIKYLESNYIRK